MDLDNAALQELADALRGQLTDVRLEVGGEASLAGSDADDPGTMDWWGEATLSVWPEDDDSSTAWWDHSGTALSTAAMDGGGRKLTVLRACGLIVNLWAVENVYDALDARSQDYAGFLPMFGQRGSFGQVELAPELDDMLGLGGGRVVILDRVRLAPAWRGLGGIGRLLIARLLRWVSDDARVVALKPFPIELDEQECGDPAIFNKALARVRRTWRSLAFEPFTDDIWIMDPHMNAHGRAVRKIAKRLGLR
ncbi:MAG TPA: hypothetical protein VIV12_19635 [Streptosporangiaceae bacterium]